MRLSMRNTDMKYQIVRLKKFAQSDLEQNTNTPIT